jgi:hypothetical protein
VLGLIVASPVLRQLAQSTGILRGNYPHRMRGNRRNLAGRREIQHGDAIAISGFGGYMSRLKVILPAAIVLAGFLVSSTASYGKPEFTKATKKACTYCHVDAQKTPKDLKDAGKYYQEHKSLDGYVEKK